LVIGDGCTDNSEHVVASLADPRLHWFNLPDNSGSQSTPTNEGLRRAKGKYIAYLNDDDLWLPNHLQELVGELENTGADFVYSILDWIQSEKSRYADIPNFPNAIRPPEATATMHRRDIIEKIGYWKEPGEVRSFPRVEYFRRAQFSGLSFRLVPKLSALKFSRAGRGYGDATLHERYMHQIRSDEGFVESELSKLLVGATYKREAPFSFAQLAHQLAHSMRLMMVRKKIDPGRLLFWKRSGWRVASWRNSLDLDNNQKSK
jgi:glycosyltransferase involved in cell wall biosynthesis